MGYAHIEVASHQISKKTGKACGDLILQERSQTSTTILLVDGLGSGIRANIYANLCASRLKELLQGGFSLRNAFSKVVDTMESAKRDSLPYSAFCLIRILNDGVCTILSYEMPQPIFVSHRTSYILPHRTYSLNNSIIGEINCSLNPGEGILAVSDGVTYAGMGKGLTYGLGVEGLNTFVNDTLGKGVDVKKLPEEVTRYAKVLWRDVLADDCSSLFAYSRKGRIINILTGPALDKESDAEMVDRFLNTEGLKIVCGGTTAKIVARHTGEKLSVSDYEDGYMTPPRYELKGMSLVTEGAVTLNQVYNIWGEDRNKLDKDNPATDLYLILGVADKVNFFVGTAENPASSNIEFTQLGILSRKKIVHLIAQKLQEEGKLVVMNTY